MESIICMTHINFKSIRKTINGKDLLVTIASTPEQIEQACRLRYDIFKVELGHGANPVNELKHAIDIDQYDAYCDHLIVMDEQSNTIVGTYRLLPLERVRDNIGLYSANEFDLRNLYDSDLPIVEVGRACIHSDYRDGSIINLLWYGMATYLQQFNYEYLCGCASLDKIANAAMASKIYQYCQRHHLLTPEHLRTYPLIKNQVLGFDGGAPMGDHQNLKRDLPTLLRAYFTIGCRIGGEPAFDPDFGVIDFFIMFERISMAKRTQRFFN